MLKITVGTKFINRDPLKNDLNVMRFECGSLLEDFDLSNASDFVPFLGGYMGIAQISRMRNMLNEILEDDKDGQRTNLE